LSNLEKLWRERIVKSILDLIILRLLVAKDRWGYEINMEIRDRFKVYLSAGTLYPLLHSLEERRLIEGVWQSEGGRGRRIYKITQRGVEFMQAGEKMSDEVIKKLQA